MFFSYNAQAKSCYATEHGAVNTVYLPTKNTKKWVYENPYDLAKKHWPIMKESRR
jgi:hypothetical protein